MKPHVALFCLLTFALAVLGCADSLNPTAPVNPAIRALGADGEGEVGLTHVQPIMLPVPEGTVESPSITAVVSADSGRNLMLDYSYRAVSGRIVWLRAWLKVDSGSIPQDTEITMAFDESMTGVVFQPEADLLTGWTIGGLLFYGR